MTTELICPKCGSDEITVDVDGYAKFPADIRGGRIVPDLTSMLDFFEDDRYPADIECSECGHASEQEGGGDFVRQG